MDRLGQFKNKYYSYGHGSNNNSEWEDVKSLLYYIWESGRSVVFHNAAFDMAIIHEEFGLPYLPAERYHDTLFMAFLKDPYAPTLSLKGFCEQYLNIPPDERDSVFEWIVANVPEAAKSPKKAGAYIAFAPADLVGEYAQADTRLTLELFDYCKDVIELQNEAYIREKRLMPVLNDNSKLGVRVDRPGLIAASAKAIEDIQQCDLWLNNYFNVTDVNYNSGIQLVKLIFAKGINDPTKDWPASPKGTPLADKDTLKEMITDPEVSSVLRHRDALSKINGTYLEPFIAQSLSTGRIYTGWNQVRGENGGTRTGRLSGRPTLQTLVTRFPKTPLPPEIKGLTFPKVRSFLLADDGDKMVAADFQAQELRLWSHFEDGELANQYRADPNADLHTFSANMMSKAAGKMIIRDHAKTMSFGILYGAGPKKISEMLNIPYSEAKELIDLYKSSVAPGLDRINADLERRYRLREPFKTIGGRLLKGEPPKMINGKMMRFGFKSLNALIQASGADFTKEAMAQYAEKTKHGRLLMSLHDEIIITVKEGHEEEEGMLLTDCMINAFKLDVPMVAEHKVGNNFSEVK